MDQGSLKAQSWRASFTPGAFIGLSLFIALIAGLADYTHQPYLLFPELGALAFVIVLKPSGAWARSPLLLCLTPFLAAIAGVAITRNMAYSPISVGLNVAITIGLIGILRSPIAPAISAGLLPLVLGIESWAYPFGILVGPGLLALWSRLPQAKRQLLLSTNQQLPPQVVNSAETHRASGFAARGSWRWVFWLALFMGLAELLVLITGSRLVLYPPLAVMAYEMLATPHECPWLERPFVMVLACLGTASVGLVMVKLLGVTAIAAGLTMLICLLWLGGLGLLMPPAIGAGLLPLLISDPNWFYPLAVALGTLLLALVSQASRLTRFKRTSTIN